MADERQTDETPGHHDHVPMIVAGDGAPMDERRLEAQIDRTNTWHSPAQWRARLAEIENQVCRIEFPYRGKTHRGTGFLVGPDLVLTNHHVVAPLFADDADRSRVRLLFDDAYQQDGRTLLPGPEYRLAADWCVDSSPRSPADLQADPVVEPSLEELDFALLRVAGDPGDEAVGERARGWILMPRDDHEFELSRTLHIVQHPEGQPMVIAFDTNAEPKLNGAGTRLRYRTNTKPGSSGAPCFGSSLEWVALHQTGDPDKNMLGYARYNQGIPVAALRGRLTDLLPSAAKHESATAVRPRAGQVRRAPQGAALAYELEQFLARSALTESNALLLVATPDATGPESPCRAEIENACAQGRTVIAIVDDITAERSGWAGELKAEDGRDGWRNLEQRLRDATPVERRRSGAPPRFVRAGEKVEVVGDEVQDRRYYLDRLIELLQGPEPGAIYLRGPSGIGKTGVVAKLGDELEAGRIDTEYRGFAYLPVFGYRPVNAAALVHAITDMLPDGEAADLVRRACRSAQPWRDILDLALDGLARTAVLVVVDNADELLDGDATLSDPELRELVDHLLSRHDHGARLLLVGGPVGSGPDHVPDFCEPVPLDDGLPEPDARDLLLRLDAAGRGRLNRDPEDLVQHFTRLTDRSPRAIELLGALVNLEPDRTLRQLIDDLRSKTTADAANDVRRQVLKQLERDAVLILQALAVFGRPVTPEAVDFLLAPYRASLRSAAPLLRLHRLRLVRRNDDGRFFLPPRDDQRWALASIDNGTVFTRNALSSRAADYFKQRIDVGEPPRDIHDLDDHLHEIDLRIQAGEHEQAMRLIRHLNSTYLMRWGRGGVVHERLNRLVGKLSDLDEYHRLCALTWMFTRQGRAAEAAQQADAALRLAHRRREAARLLVSRAHAEFSQGLLDEAITTYRQALRKIPLGFIRGRAMTRAAIYVGLSQVHVQTGGFDTALTLLGKVEPLLALTFDSRSGDAYQLRVAAAGNRAVIHLRRDERPEAEHCLDHLRRTAERAELRPELAAAHLHLANLRIAQQEWRAAEESVAVAGEIAAETGNLHLRRDAQTVLAMAALCRDELKQAGDAIRIAVRHDPTAEILILQGTIALQKQQRQEALTAFRQGWDLLPARPGRDFHLLDAQGLILTGLALCTDQPHHVDDAVAAFRAARALTEATGVVNRIKLLLTRLGTPAAPVPAEVLAAAGC
ncbi:hypothetical protein Q0Z83_023020 [Actinoplanes sichuanensis]|uniref:Trypsin-like peptidase domain-containing protein n=1 Tax=Actinoplanes sichuanensis TaxID=512349 RepID=A0ABW4A0N6_9ACTN|nr:trypsin-like peptidase domain-containing protein [Actinoplanes sichuanensis]BEL04111.1 hypothetical protein Q0Z83_023020 [Actinoplanes sichuanensis]